MSDQNWRTETNALDYLGHQKKKVGLADRRPVIRKPSDLVGPGIAANAIRLDDFNDHLATYDGFFSADVGALNAPNTTDAFVGTVTSDETLGGVQTFAGLTTGSAYQRVFNRNPSDEATIYWGDWEIIGTAGTGGGPFLETLPVSIMDAKGDLIVGTANNAASREAVGDDGTSLVADSSTSTGVAWDTRVRTLVPSGDITIDDTDPLNPIIGTIGGDTPIMFDNTDEGTCTGANINIVIPLAHVPNPGSEQVFYNGIPLKAEDWSRTETVLTIPGERWFRAGRKAWVDYSYYTDSEAITPFFVSKSSVVNDHTTIPSPSDPVAGDLLVLVLSATNGVGCSDPRFTLKTSGTRPGWVGPLMGVWLGVDDGSGDDITVHMDSIDGSGGADSCGAIMRIRGYPLLPLTAEASSSANAGSYTPTMPSGGLFGIMAFASETGLVPSTPNGDTLGNWTTQHLAAGGGGGHTSIYLGTASGVPAGNWTSSGSDPWFFGWVGGIQ